ncbi:2,3-diaminopropionate biosynthesis protein SbnA [Paenibacillus sp. MMS18-CY102]|uniref:2,3-diaminopropionate biosynthesis protein SbnA n=1 Tax=Paenibacillus sp. MMS18-CY102 TaxID=2682849 RepID=UPI0013652AD9|nr:2,3-diaminopropionate biosynthesis protein SbnA [Paenibacillus sp. MMS18-CY102]
MFDRIIDRVGNTPLLKIPIQDLPTVNVYSKLEFHNPTGSVKDRAASYILHKLIEDKEIVPGDTIIESTSGNFGIALAVFTQALGYRFICVIDPNISEVNEFLIRKFCPNVIKVSEVDENGGYLLSRIKKVKQLLREIPNSYWINQYSSEYNADAYCDTLGEELIGEIGRIDYLFLGVSSGGTITGVSRKIKQMFPDCKVIAVDIYGSVIFGQPPKKRYIPGIGSSMVPEILKNALIDDVIYVDEVETVEGCHELLQSHYIFAGGSSGSVYVAIKKYFKDANIQNAPNVVTIFPDKGERYLNTIYNNEWCRRLIANASNEIKYS